MSEQRKMVQEKCWRCGFPIMRLAGEKAPVETNVCFTCSRQILLPLSTSVPEVGNVGQGRIEEVNTLDEAKGEE